MMCSKCGTDSATKHGSYRNKTGLFQRYKCQSCGNTWYDKTVLKVGDKEDDPNE